MAVHTHSSGPTNWWLWGGAAAAVILVIAVVGYGYDWFAPGSTEAVTPAAEESAPASE